MHVSPFEGAIMRTPSEKENYNVGFEIDRSKEHHRTRLLRNL